MLSSHLSSNPLASYPGKMLAFFLCLHFYSCAVIVRFFSS